MLGMLKMKFTRLAAGCAKDGYWFATDLPATIFRQKFSSALNQMLFYRPIFCGQLQSGVEFTSD